MPLLGKRPWVPNPPLKDLTHTDEVWVIRFTNEAFRSYEDYLARWEHYRQPVWTCRYTGRSNLTYEEALLSEADAEHISLQIPEDLLIQMALQMHKFVGSQDALAERVQKHFREDMASGKTKPITKAVIRQVIKLVADKEGYKGAPWMLKKEFCAKHNLTVSRDLPPALMEAKQKYDERHKRGRDEDDEEKMKGESDESEASPVKKRLRIIEGPKDDLALEGADAQPPQPTSEFPIPARAVGDMLMTFTFLVSYRQKLGIQNTFTLGDFENILLSEDPSDLMEEVLVRLLKSVYYGDPTSTRITGATYSAVLRKWLRTLQLLDRSILDISSVVDQIQETSFQDLAADVKVTVLGLLVRACLDSPAVRQHLDESYETSLELQKEERVFEEEEKQRERITAAFERKKKQTELNLEKMVAKLRSVSLGYDRHYRRYWFWPAAGPRLWVETPSASFYDSLGIPHPPALKDYLKAEEEEKANAMEKEDSEKSMNGTEEPNEKSKHEQAKEEAESESKAKADEAEAEAEAEPKTEDEEQRGEGALNGVENGVAQPDLPVEVSYWAYYDTIEQVDELISFLNEEGPREKELKANLERKYQKISDAMQRPYHSSARQRVVLVPQYDMPVRRSTRLARSAATTAATETRTSSRRARRG